jgi:crotonobetainyl-CoA:carnitine CoA-transferase CaiB-like acyl-CoA transferase
MATDSKSEPKGALAGVRVLDLSRVIAGPICGQTLADLGADIIKVERPKVGDDSRAWGPPFALDRNGKPTAESAVYCGANRGKRSITANLGTQEGCDLVQKIALKSDVLIENYKFGTLDKYGLGYAELAAENPGLIYCSLTGFGQTGPYKNRPGYDTIVQAMGGLMSITGHKDGAPGGGPMKVGVALIDFMTGLYATIAIQAALAYRNRTGLGQHIDLALLDVQVAALANIAMNYLVSGDIPIRNGNRIPSVYPSDSFRCKDGYLMLLIGNEEQYKRFCTTLGRPELAADERFQTNALRLKNADVLAPELEAVMIQHTIAEWAERFEKNGVPYSVINNIAQVFDDPQVRARNMLLHLDHPTAGKMPSIASPIRLSRSPVEYEKAPPTLGQHTSEVLEELLGLSPSEISNLSKAGAI